MSQITLTGSVGVNGKNNKADIKTVQSALNQILDIIKPTRKLAVDGSLGRQPEKSKTVAAINIFQKKVVKMFKPDGVIDANGRTIAILRQKAKQQSLRTISSKVKVSYSSSLPKEKQLVSEYAIKVVKMALTEVGMEQAVITSTLRTPEQQAQIMYRNAKKNLVNQFRLYGSTGDEVLKVYKKNASSSESEVVKLMTDKINSLLKQGKRTSNHCATSESYKNLNIIDIGVNSTKAAAGSSFKLEAFTKSLNNLATEGYIEKVIDETKKSNTCWHIEVKPNKKPITAKLI